MYTQRNVDQKIGRRNGFQPKICWNRRQEHATKLAHHPALGSLERDRPIAVHRRLQKFSSSDIPKEDEADSGSDRQDVALEGDRADATAVVARWDLLDRLKNGKRTLKNSNQSARQLFAKAGI